MTNPRSKGKNTILQSELSLERQMKRIVTDLALRDKKLGKVIALHPLCTVGRNIDRRSHFESLVRSVISQQLAVKAADTIYQRVAKLAGGKVTPSTMNLVSERKMREAGVSGAKFRAIQGLTDASLSKKIPINQLHKINDDQEIFDALTSLWGIGPWTVDMFMMFQLGRLNIWPTGDLGVRRGWEKIYSLKEEISPALLEVKGEKFTPYRSVVAWYCWRALENN